jgi:hypothetical protein
MIGTHPNDCTENDRLSVGLKPFIRRSACPDADSASITLAWQGPKAGDTTTAWITADAELVVNGSDMQ